MRFKSENKDLFNAFGSILDARGIKVEYINDNVYIGEAFNDDHICFYVRPNNGRGFTFNENEIKEIFTPINIDGYQFVYEDFLPYYNEGGIISPELIMFIVTKDGKNVVGGIWILK